MLIIDESDSITYSDYAKFESVMELQRDEWQDCRVVLLSATAVEVGNATTYEGRLLLETLEFKLITYSFKINHDASASRAKLFNV